MSSSGAYRQATWLARSLASSPGLPSPSLRRPGDEASLLPYHRVSIFCICLGLVILPAAQIHKLVVCWPPRWCWAVDVDRQCVCACFMRCVVQGRNVKRASGSCQSFQICGGVKGYTLGMGLEHPKFANNCAWQSAVFIPNLLV